MTSSYLNDMYDVTGVNVFPRKLMEFPRKEKVNSVPYPLLPFDSVELKIWNSIPKNWSRRKFSIKSCFKEKHIRQFLITPSSKTG